MGIFHFKDGCAIYLTFDIRFAEDAQIINKKGVLSTKIKLVRSLLYFHKRRPKINDFMGQIRDKFRPNRRRRSFHYNLQKRLFPKKKFAEEAPCVQKIAGTIAVSHVETGHLRCNLGPFGWLLQFSAKSYAFYAR